MKLEDIARKAGVSRSTVSRVVNNEPYVSAATREKVMAVIIEERFTPNPAARALVTQRTQLIGIVVPQTLTEIADGSYYFSALLQGISDITNARDYSTLLWLGHSTQDKERFVERILRNRLMDGLIIASSTNSELLISHLVKLDIPFVMVERPMQYLDQISYIGLDNEGAVRNVIQHLYDIGRRRIATITGNVSNLDAQDRLTGYKQGLEQVDLPYDPRLVVQGRFDYEGGYEAMKQLLSESIDAVFAGSDATATGALRAMKEANVRVPEDIALAGFDDLAPARQSSPQLTTVHHPVQQKGEAATNLLLDLIEGRIEGVHHQVLPTQLVIRESTRQL
jgi:LacI family transcriptional regulator